MSSTCFLRMIRDDSFVCVLSTHDEQEDHMLYENQTTYDFTNAKKMLPLSCSVLTLLFAISYDIWRLRISKFGCLIFLNKKFFKVKNSSCFFDTLVECGVMQATLHCFSCITSTVKWQALRLHQPWSRVPIKVGWNHSPVRRPENRTTQSGTRTHNAKIWKLVHHPDS